MQHDQLVLAYLAGVIDSDGYVTIQRSTHGGSLYFGAKVGIAGTRREPHDLASSYWGGKVSRHMPRNSAHKDQYQWSRCGKAAAAILIELLPYLRIKHENACLALRLNEHTEHGRCDDPYPWMGPSYCPAADSNEMFLEAKSLNCRVPRRPKVAA